MGLGSLAFIPLLFASQGSFRKEKCAVKGGDGEPQTQVCGAAHTALLSGTAQPCCCSPGWLQAELGLGHPQGPSSVQSKAVDL